MIRRVVCIVLACAAMAGPSWAELRVAPHDRIENGTTGTCAWCSIEMLGRAHGIKEIRGLAAYYQKLGKRGTTVEDADAELTKRGIKHKVYAAGIIRKWDSLEWAGTKKGLVIGVIDWPARGDCHAILVINWKDKKAIFIDPNDPHSRYEVGDEWLDRHWTGWAVAIWK